MSGVSKLAAERHQRQLEELVSQPGNDSCADCKSKSPRWASHNLGIFICMRCAGLHRKLGTHISKVKSLSLDSWSKEQVESMRKIGNVKSNQIWNPDERRNPLPENMEESERDSEMEKYIRSKYQFGRFKSKSSIVEAYLGPSQSKTSLPPRSQTAPIKSGASPRPRSAASVATPPLPVGQQSSLSSLSASSALAPPSAALTSAPQPRASSFSVSSALPSIATPQRTTTLPFSASLPSSQPMPSIRPNQQASLSSSTFNDLISIQAPSNASTFPLQYQNTSSPANPYATLSPGGAPSAFATDRSPAFRSVSLPGPSSYGQFTPMGGTPATSSTFNPFFQQQQQQQQVQFQPQQFNSITPTISPTSGPSPFNPFSQSFQQQLQIASPPPDFGQNQGLGGMSPVAPQPQMFSMPTNDYQANQSTTPFGMISPTNGAQPYQQTPSPSFALVHQQAQSPPQMQTPWQQQQGSSHLSQQAQQAQQLFKSMASGNDGTGRNPFAFQ